MIKTTTWITMYKKESFRMQVPFMYVPAHWLQVSVKEILSYGYNNYFHTGDVVKYRAYVNSSSSSNYNGGADLPPLIHWLMYCRKDSFTLMLMATHSLTQLLQGRGIQL